MDFKITVRPNDLPTEHVQGRFNITVYTINPAPRLPSVVDDWYGDNLHIGFQNAANVMDKTVLAFGLARDPVADIERRARAIISGDPE